MRYVKIKGTDMEMSNIGFGTIAIGLKQTQDEANSLLAHYLENGGNYLDTASMYSDWVEGEKSRSEKAIGRWLADHGRRDSFYIGTKGGHPGLGAGRRPRINSEDVGFDLDNSLINLKTDYIDLYWLHRDDVNKSVEEILFMMENFVVSGKIRYYACSNWTLDRIIEAEKVANINGWKGFAGNQIEWSCTKINQEAIRDKTMQNMDIPTLEYHNKSQMPVFSFTSQAGGLYDRVYQYGFESIPDFMQNKYRNDATEKISKIIFNYIKYTDITPTQFALAYLHSRKDKFALVTLAGTSSKERLTTIMDAGGIDIQADIVKEINKILFEK